MQEIIKKMNEYNKIAARWCMGEMYLDDKDVLEEVKLKHTDKFISIAGEMTEYLKWFDEKNFTYTEDEILIGFNVDFRVMRFEKYNY